MNFLKKIIVRLKNSISYRIYVKYNDFLYDRIFRPALIWRVRHKSKIKVLFLLDDLSVWKTESLYLEMKKNKRFIPMLGITSSIEIKGAEQAVKEYCQEKKYPYTIIKEDKTLTSQVHPDIVLYQKPYQWKKHLKHKYNYNLTTLFIHETYAFHAVLADWSLKNKYLSKIWQLYFEDEQTAEDYRRRLPNKGVNIVVTGTSLMDRYLSNEKNFCHDPWKDKNGKKRIIYAPHHTIGEDHLEGIAYSTFLDYYDYMLYLAKKYEEDCCFVFRPHPLLYEKLVEYWGREKTDSYYAKWNHLSNGQLETGAYDGLFKYSDALIHDCCSFRVEYQYTHKPSLYLLREDNNKDNLCYISRRAHELQYKARDKEDVEKFVIDVINHNDVRYAARNAFYRECLIPPNGKSACTNIINAILGKEEYSRSHKNNASG